MSVPKPAEFSKIRAALWPIHGHEMKKFLPMAAIMFLILFNYTVVRSLKDAMIIAAKGSGAEVVNFLKSWVVLPCSVLFVVIFAKMSNVLSRQALYYACLVPFIAFFAIFAFIIFPLKDFLHPSVDTLQSLQESVPFLKWAFPIYGLWTYSIFYVMAELWGNIGTNLLFWQFANQITPTIEAKRFYPMFGLLGNTALLLAGRMLSSYAAVPMGVDPEIHFGKTIQDLIFWVVTSGIGIGVIYYWMCSSLMKQPDFYQDIPKTEKKAKKPKMSIMESFKYLASSKYLGYITILVLGYGMTINLVEVTWKAKLKEAFPTSASYTAFMGDLYTWLGPITMLILFTTKGAVRRFGWKPSAMATPIMIMVTGIAFFVFVLWQDSLTGIMALAGLTPLMAAVYMGMGQNIMSKGTKYALFDPTREMAYIPLDQEMKVKGKAAIDVVGGRMGKSAGGWIQLLFLAFLGGAGTQIMIAPYLVIIMLVIGCAWIWAVKRLSVEYNALVKSKEKAA
ncbi:MAG: Npt1/Npt2 family nucleotide transporter [Holosporaceae bacterium]